MIIFFFGNGPILSLNIYIRVEFFPSEILHVYKVLNSLVDFSINTTLKLPIKLVFRTLSKGFGKSGREGKNSFIFVFSRRKANGILEICLWETFYRLVL